MSESKSLHALYKDSYLFNGDYLETLYERYLQGDGADLPPHCLEYFSSMQERRPEISHQAIRDYFADRVHLIQRDSNSVTAKSMQLLHWIDAYRKYGHYAAQLDPLGMAAKRSLPELDKYSYGLTDQEQVFELEGKLGLRTATLSTIHERLIALYAGTIGFEYQHLSQATERNWLCERIERVREPLSKEKKQDILRSLTQSEGLEKYLGLKYVAQKRFSLEGGESLIPLLQALIQRAGHLKVRKLVIGMAHRGRLNVLVNLLGKAPRELFDEFESVHVDEKYSGDVKYHKGFSADLKTETGTIHVTLGFNPSHLEIINPVIEGSVRAHQERYGDSERLQVIPVLIHGDASFSGQGVVMETFGLSQTSGYTTGGTIHIVINNQIGFTTNPSDSRSSWYCTDVAKIIELPIFHVNADDPEAVLFVTKLAFDFRMNFHRDVVIDLVCYRRHGHNEADEPAVTQPLMYQTIKDLASVRKKYADQLIAEQVCSAQEVDVLVQEYRTLLDSGDSIVSNYKESEKKSDWHKYPSQDWRICVVTAVSMQQVRTLAQRLEVLPAHWTLQAQVAKLLEQRRQMTAEKIAIDWGYAETLAYASLLQEGYSVRICGQDSGRGTFFHRHAKLYDYKTNQIYIPLEQLTQQNNRFAIIDSTLSEMAVLGFEYGYASTDPNTLVIWEAQYGDFANNAQVIIDQFLSSSEQKWKRLCGLVLFLPHGSEGAGPEHTSARLERFLQLCAQENMQICVPTTPAQIFHLLRRQMLRPYRKPLIVFSPKSLLRHKLAVSSLQSLTQGEFQILIPEVESLAGSAIKKVILCSGKIYYDLLEQRRKQSSVDTVILRIEQLYPFPYQELRAQLQYYCAAQDVIWCQEESKNQGAWCSIEHRLLKCLASKQTLRYVGRTSSASPAVGSSQWHLAQQRALVEAAFVSQAV